MSTNSDPICQRCGNYTHGRADHKCPPLTDSVKRYSSQEFECLHWPPHANNLMLESVDGDWVKFTAYESLKAENDRLKEAYSRLDATDKKLYAEKYHECKNLEARLQEAEKEKVMVMGRWEYHLKRGTLLEDQLSDLKAKFGAVIEEIEAHVYRLENFDNHFDRDKNIKIIKSILKSALTHQAEDIKFSFGNTKPPKV